MFSITARVCTRMSRLVVPNSSASAPAMLLSGRRLRGPGDEDEPAGDLHVREAPARRGLARHRRATAPRTASRVSRRHRARPGAPTPPSDADAEPLDGGAHVRAGAPAGRPRWPRRPGRPSPRRRRTPCRPASRTPSVERPPRVTEDRRRRADLGHPAVDLQQHAEVRPAPPAPATTARSTKPAAEVLSAITSGSEKLKSAYRESISSMAGATARDRRGEVADRRPRLRQPGPARNATSGSTRGWM